MLKGYLFDLYGTAYRSDTLIPGGGREGLFCSLRKEVYDGE
jgi:ribonucleotide monophosphatase NagD (HAD superfamily)